MSDVRNFYANKTIFITGVTGFLGQVLLWKLLRSCPEIRRIYTLVREKKGKTIERRIEEIFENPIYSSNDQSYADFATKVKPIKGDCSLDKLGISDEDRAILETEVDVIFHSAATVRFDGELRETAYTNIRSTDILLDMAKNMKKLKSFIYVSTAFAACAENVLIEEKFYDPPMKARDLLTLIDQLDERSLAIMTPKLTRPHPNTYIYTKLIAEYLCHEKGDGMPLSVFRPAIEPLLGWVNNTNGPVGLITGYLAGVMKVARVNEDCIADLVPCDLTIKALIVAAYRTGQLWEKSLSSGTKYEIPIFNYSNTATKLHLTWQRLFTTGKRILHRYAFSDMVTPPSLKIVRNPIVFRILFFLCHTLPAYLIDGTLLALGKPIKFVDLQRKISKLMELTVYFSIRDWIIPNTNMNELLLNLSETDKQTFDYDLNSVCLEKYCECFVRGIRRFILKESEDTIESAIKRYKKLVFLQHSIIAIVMLTFAYLLIKFVFL